LLTPAGLARFAPGVEMANRLLDLGSVIGERAANGLLDRAHSNEAVAALDAWLRARLLGDCERPETDLARVACTLLARATRVDVAADRLGISRRHLSRIVRRHVGISPKALIELYRLDRSLRAVQGGLDSGTDGFADQAHQVREWKRRLGITPGRYARSALAEALEPAAGRPAFYL
jgi:AraC-like DNA-binding protein